MSQKSRIMRKYFVSGKTAYYISHKSIAEYTMKNRSDNTEELYEVWFTCGCTKTVPRRDITEHCPTHGDDIDGFTKYAPFEMEGRIKAGYCRVSTEDQNPDLQLAALKRAGCRWLFTDKTSGALAKRPQLKKCLALLRDGDMLVVWKLDRLGRSVKDLITLLDDLKSRNIAFQSVTEAIDTTTATGRAMWQMVGVLAELERSLIDERTKAGRAAAIARGVKMGRKAKLSSEQVKHARKLIDDGEHPRNVAASMGCSMATLYRAL